MTLNLIPYRPHSAASDLKHSYTGNTDINMWFKMLALITDTDLYSFALVLL